MTAPDLDAIAARYSAALNAKPSKGEWTQRRIDALTDSVSDVGELVGHVAMLTGVLREANDARADLLATIERWRVAFQDASGRLVAAEAEVDRLNDGRRQMRHRFHQVARYARALRKELASWQDSHALVEEERDRLRAAVDAVRGVAAEVERDNEDHLDRFGQHLQGSVVVVAEMIRAALDEHLGEEAARGTFRPAAASHARASATNSTPGAPEYPGAENGPQNGAHDPETEAP